MTTQLCQRSADKSFRSDGGTLDQLTPASSDHARDEDKVPTKPTLTEPHRILGTLFARIFDYPPRIFHVYQS